jgi:tRNA-modifying protein YgfZ
VSNLISKLNQFGVLEIAGEDATDFLQSQLTSDVKELGNKEWQFSAWCNAKGRVIANFFVVRFQNSYFLILPEVLIDTVSKRLTMYILRSKVSISNRTNDMSCYGLHDEAIRNLESYPGFNDNYLRIDITDSLYKRVIIVSTTSLPADDKLITSEAPIVDNSTWQAMDIQAGIPWISNNTTEMIIPQELGLDNLRGLSLNKGCYPGQEIIARLHYRGKVKQGLYIGKGQHSNLLPETGEKLYTSDVEESCGTIINLIQEDDGQLLIMAVLNHIYSNQDSYNLENKLQINVKFSAANFYPSS